MAKRRHHSNEFKFKVALEADKGIKTLSELAAEYQLHPTQISDRKRHLLDTGMRYSTDAKRARNASRKHGKQNATNRSAGSRWNLSG